MAAEVLGGASMGGRENRSAAKICDVAGEATCSSSGESTYTHQGARKRGVGGVGGTDGEDPEMASRGRSGLQGTQTSIGATKRTCCRTLWPQAHLVAP